MVTVLWKKRAVSDKEDLPRWVNLYPEQCTKKEVDLVQCDSEGNTMPESGGHFKIKWAEFVAEYVPE